MKSVCILGLGSPAGDDQLGWRVIAELERSAFVATRPGAIVLQALDRSHAALMEHMQGASRLVVVDAVTRGGAPGTLLHWNDINAPTPVPANEWDLAAHLQLAHTLGQLPAHWDVLAVVVESHGAAAIPGDAVFAAVPHVVATIEQWLDADVAPTIPSLADVRNLRPSAA